MAQRKASERSESDLDSDILFHMANLGQEATGLPFVVWISRMIAAGDDARLRVSPGPRAKPSEMITVALGPKVRVIEGRMKASDLALLERWINLNLDVLIRYWDGDIHFTRDAINAIRPLPN